jgi:hypothetical protein
MNYISNFLSNYRDAKDRQADEKSYGGWNILGPRDDYVSVYGFEDDKYKYADIAPEEMNDSKLTWRKYTVFDKDGDADSYNKFSVGYDSDGKIAGVMRYNEDGDTMSVYNGREALKRFFSMFDRDATRYHVVQEEDNGDGTGQAAVIYDTDYNDSPFIPSNIFRNTPLRRPEPRGYDTPRYQPNYSPDTTPTTEPGQSGEFIDKWRGLKDDQRRIQEKIKELQNNRPRAIM